MALLSIDNVSVSYGKAEAVRNVSLEVERGQIVTVIGPNGAGKTSLLTSAIGMIKGRAVVEVSGGVTIETVGAYADAGADLISAGMITNSAPNLDIGLDLE